MDRKAIAMRIQTMRMSRGMSQAELAREIHVGQPTVAMWESGQRVPNRESTEALADLFNVSPGLIIHGELPQDEDDELWELREAMRRNPDVRVLFDLSKNASPKAIKRTVAVLKALKDDDEG